MSYLNQFLFGIYPYIALAVFFVGSLLRFDRDQYTWKSDSSQLLRAGQLRWGSNLFHLGILGIFFGHLFGLLTPLAVWHVLGVSAGGQAAARGRRRRHRRRRCAWSASCCSSTAGSPSRGSARPRRPMDMFVLLLLLAQLLLGLFSITVSLQHLDGAEMIKLMTWAQHLVTFRGDAASFVADVAPVFKLHLVLGMTIFLVFPFSRLVHIWAGFAAAGYLVRAYQLVRSR